MSRGRVSVRGGREGLRAAVPLVLVGSLVMAMVSPADGRADEHDDPYAWLEDVEADRSLEWVRARNAECVAELAEGDAFRAVEARLLGILDSDARIPVVTRIGDHFYNFWRDPRNPRGLWRRTTLDSYRAADPAWETVLDIDALGRAEGENWVWHGATVLRPEDRRCLVALSRGGADADVVREFDLGTRAFVADGFALPEAKSRVAWRDVDTLLVATDTGPGSLTDSGYPRTVREWRRGTSLDAAPILFEGRPADMVVTAFHDPTPGFERDFVVRRPTFYTADWFVRRGGVNVPLEKPADAEVHVHREWLFLELRSPWTVGDREYPAGSLLAADFERYLAGDRTMHVLFTPGPRTSLAGFDATRSHILLTSLDNVRSRIDVCTWHGEDTRQGMWHTTPLPGVPEIGTARATAIDDIASDDYFLVTSSPVQPSTLAIGRLPGGHAAAIEPAEAVKRSPAFFRADELVVTQHEAVSGDGTRVPYFQIGPAKLPPDGSTPTLLYGYGGFEIPLVPGYDPLAGAAWLESGGVYVIANIRGGGEFGPAWHQAALREKRPRAYEDFAAVAEDLIRRQVTSPARLGIRGGSNGGLLVGNLYASRPELFGAVVCQVPLLDMRRFNRLLAGASWMGEYGNPDLPDEWAFIRTFSPYHLVDEARDYPPLLITTSTRDDRVHPGHARKMAARLRSFGKRVLSYENIEGGHGGAADNRQKAFMDALAWEFLRRTLAVE